MRRGQVRERRFRREQKLPAGLDAPPQLFEVERRVYAELARARAPERREVRARTERLAERLGQRAHVSPGRADDPRAHVARPAFLRMKDAPVFVGEDFKLAHADAHGLALDLL